MGPAQPENILLTADRVVKLAGVALLLPSPRALACDAILPS